MFNILFTQSMIFPSVISSFRSHGLRPNDFTLKSILSFVDIYLNKVLETLPSIWIDYTFLQFHVRIYNSLIYKSDLRNDSERRLNVG